MVLVFRDITERERMEKELVRASRLESVGILAGGIAHDFNNILTAVIANLSLAKLDIQGDSDLATCVREAESATLRARDLTQQLLTFANGGEPVRSAVDFTSVVREVTEFALHGAKANCTFDLEDGLWPVDADKGQLGRVIQNLVINAVQAMPEGGTIRIVARNHAVIGIGRPAVDPGDYVHISIQDSGTGIKPKDLPHIFDPYFTTKQTGTGLGLAAVYSIIKKHRGLIDVDSELKKGTTFHIWMPALRASKALPEAASLSAIVPMKGKILFMDDEPSIRSMATMLMRRIGLEVVAVSDGREVIDKYNAALEDGTPFSLVIMDLTVPGGMGGREALSYLREIDAAVKVVVSSGYSSDPIMANHKEHGFCGMIAKPYDVGQFNRVIVETLGRGCLGATPSAN
jgi:nitrogen-specific signal transduction histidine kinase/CheY-like chemotaxis protein